MKLKKTRFVLYFKDGRQISYPLKDVLDFFKDDNNNIFRINRRYGVSYHDLNSIDFYKII